MDCIGLQSFHHKIYLIKQIFQILYFSFSYEIKSRLMMMKLGTTGNTNSHERSFHFLPPDVHDSVRAVHLRAKSCGK